MKAPAGIILDIDNDKTLYKTLAVIGAVFALIISAAIAVKLGSADGLFCVWLIIAFYLSLYFIACFVVDPEKANEKNWFYLLFVNDQNFSILALFVIAATVGSAAAIWHLGAYMLSKI